MDKPFKTYNQQLGILRKRNLIIKNGSKAISLLKTNGYYSIINGYKDIFLDSELTKQFGDDRYKPGTTFEHIYALYNFDRNIRSIMLKHILKMETSLKTKCAYYFSKAYQKDFNYLDINNYDNADPKNATTLINDLTNVINNNTSNNQKGARFYHYLDKHKELPLWVLVTKMSMGNIVKFYNTMKPALKYLVIEEIVKAYEKQYKINITIPIKDQEAFMSNMFFLINVFRNTCAHEERLYNLIYKNKGKLPKIALFHKETPRTFESRVFDGILIIGLFVTKKDYNTLVHSISEEIDLLSKELPQNVFNQVLLQMGFHKNWKAEIKLP